MSNLKFLIPLMLCVVSLKSQEIVPLLEIGTNIPLQGWASVDYSIAHSGSPSSKTVDANYTRFTNDNLYQIGPDFNQVVIGTTSTSSGSFIEGLLTFSDPIPVEYIGFVVSDLDYTASSFLITINSGTATLSDFDIHRYGGSNALVYNTTTGLVKADFNDDSQPLAASGYFRGKPNTGRTIQSLTIRATVGGGEGLGIMFSSTPDDIDPCLVNPCLAECDPCGPGCDGASAQEVTEEFNYTGSDQTFTVPVGVTEIEVKAWGAGGPGGSGASFDSRGGTGGFVSGTIAVNEGDVFSVVVAEQGQWNGAVLNSHGYGFGGSVTGRSGGGLSGIFEGGNQVSISDQSRAILVAGGGGSADYCDTDGLNGGSNSSGGRLNMGGQAVVDPGQATCNGIIEHGGGGGYYGGSVDYVGGANWSGCANNGCAVFQGINYGGSNFVASMVTNPVNMGNPDDPNPTVRQTFLLPPQNTDPDYNTGVGIAGEGSNSSGGGGLVIIKYSQGAVVCCNDGSIAMKKIYYPECPTSSYVDFKVYNGDDAPMPLGTPISFYDGDPTQAGAILISTYNIVTTNGLPIQNGATENFRKIDIGTCSLQNADNRLFAVLADDGTHSLPLDLSTQTSDGYDDCTMTDNMSSIKIKTVCAEYGPIIHYDKDGNVKD